MVDCYNTKLLFVKMVSDLPDILGVDIPYSPVSKNLYNVVSDNRFHTHESAFFPSAAVFLKKYLCKLKYSNFLFINGLFASESLYELFAGRAASSAVL